MSRSSILPGVGATPTRRVRRRLTAAVSCVAVLASLALTPAPASARPAIPGAAVAAVAAVAPVAPVADTLVVPTGEIVRTKTRIVYGLAPGRTIPIGNRTTSILIRPEFSAPVDGVQCSFFRQGTYVSALFSAAQWDGGSAALAVPAQTTGTEGQVDCYSQGEPAFELTWHLTSSTVPATRATLTQDVAFVTSRDETRRYEHFSGSVGTVGIRDTIRLEGAPGTWPTTGTGPAPVYSLLLYVRDPRGVEQYLTDYAVSPDGSALTVQVPDALPARFWGSEAYLRATASSGAPQSSSTTSFESYITVAPHRASTTRLILLPPVTLSSWKTRATVRLRSPGLTDVHGKLTLIIDGRERDFIFVEPADHSRVTFDLPSLPKGRHTIQIVFEGDPRGVAGSSARATLRVLR